MDVRVESVDGQTVIVKAGTALSGRTLSVYQSKCYVIAATRCHMCVRECVYVYVCLCIYVTVYVLHCATGMWHMHHMHYVHMCKCTHADTRYTL